MTSPLQPPPGSWGAAPGAPALPPAAASSAPRRRGGLLVLGAALVVAAIVATVALLLAASARYDRGVQNLARAPIGCTTNLQFDEGGTFWIFAETVGRIGALEGDCPNGSDEYRYGGSGVPQVELVMVDPSGGKVTIDPDDGSKRYDADGRQGISVGSVQIGTAGEYRLTVTSQETNVAIAVGKDPKAGADTLRTIGIVLGAVLLVAGIVVLVLGLRRRPAAAAAGARSAAPVDQSVWAPAAPAPTQQMLGAVPPPPPPMVPPGAGGGTWAPPPPPPQH